MKVYVYVERGKLPSIRKHGLLSARAQYETLGALPVEKYATQLAAALVRFKDLRAIVEPLPTDEEKTLAYLDWRDESTLNGSRAIYFLYHPIPTDPRVQAFIQKYRGDFLRDRVLLEYDLPDDTAFTRVGDIDLRRAREERWWVDLWLSQPPKSDLWFANIPHGYFVPASGTISIFFLKKIG